MHYSNDRPKCYTDVSRQSNCPVITDSTISGRYQWKCDALNAPSRAAAERLGFSFEGLFRQARVNKGRNRDTAWYAAVDHEWPVLKAAFTRWLDPSNFDPRGQQRVSLRELTGPILVRRG